MKKSIVVGIDVSKHTLDYNWLPGGISSQTSNTRKGIVSLLHHLAELSPAMVVLEATGGYQQAVVEALAEAGITYAVVNPRQVRDFARSLNRLGKTDKLDALTLAEFGQSRSLRPSVAKSPERSLLSELLRRREQLLELVLAEKNHLEHATGSFGEEIRDLLDILSKRVDSIEKRIQEVIQSDRELAAQDALIQSVPGLGPITSSSLLAFVPEISVLDRKQLCALVGVAPFNRDSGKYRGRRSIYGGRGYVRKVLYCAMRVCVMHNAVVRMWFEGFRNRGKAYKVALVACMRKLLVVIRAMLLSGSGWDPNYHIKA